MYGRAFTESARTTTGYLLGVVCLDFTLPGGLRDDRHPGGSYRAPWANWGCAVRKYENHGHLKVHEQDTLAETVGANLHARSRQSSRTLGK